MESGILSSKEEQDIQEVLKTIKYLESKLESNPQIAARLQSRHTR